MIKSTQNEIELCMEKHQEVRLSFEEACEETIAVWSEPFLPDTGGSQLLATEA